MRIFTKVIITILFLFSLDSAIAQNSNVFSALRDPNPPKKNYTQNSSSVESYLSRWFGNSITGSTGIVKSFLNNPGSLTLVSASSRSLYGAARNSAGVYYAVEYVSLGTGNLVTIDTSSGAINTVAALSGLGGGHVVTGMAWDNNSGIMYVVSVDGAVGRLYTVNLTTGALTTIAASMAGSTFPIDIAINNSSVMYSIDVNSDVLNTINKSTGAATLVGSLGININFAQGMAFDPDTDSLFLAAYTDAGRLYRCNTSNGATTLIGAFGSSGNEIDAFIIPPKTNRQLNAFNLQTPSDGLRIVTVAGSSTPVVISWDTSGTGANYKFIFGNPTVPPRRIVVASSVNSINTTLGALDALLASYGFTNNGSATDSAIGQWDVWAYKGTGAPGADSLKSTNGPRALTLRRQQNLLVPFVLASPSSGTTFVISPVDTSHINFSWRNSGAGNNFKWLFKNAGTYSDPATFRFASNNSGFDSVISIRNSFLDSALVGLGVAAGDSITGTWKARSYSGTDSINSTAPDRQVTFRRIGLLPLYQDFSQTIFPPLYWSLEYTGSLYWSREIPSAYGSGTGSARFKYWSADNGTTQSLISNQFPPVTLFNILMFSYAHRFYLDGSNVLAPDSLGVYSSTDNGSTWTLAKMLITTQTPQIGTNSSTNLTTTSGSGEYLIPAGNEWATKYVQTPVQTNRIKFIAYSAYGNNLFIDNIYYGPIDGTGNPISFTPLKFELSQNYPNPFNPTTKINFSIPKQSFVTLKVFDMLGREVAELLNKELSPNNYSIDFNASNFSSGVYFYKLESAEFTEVKRMMLIK